VTDIVVFPALSLKERDRRWALAQQLIAAHDLAALLVYGEPEGSWVPHFAADNYFTNDRTGGVVLIPRDQPPLILGPLHLMIGGHLEARRRGDECWLAPEQFVTHTGTIAAGGGRGGAFIVECLRAAGRHPRRRQGRRFPCVLGLHGFRRKSVRMLRGPGAGPGFRNCCTPCSGSGGTRVRRFGHLRLGGDAPGSTGSRRGQGSDGEVGQQPEW
jgi:hypothetical protein